MKQMKLKFNANIIKEFDYKGFFLKYGEWIGLGIAVAIALPVLFSGATKVFRSESPTANAQEVTLLADNAKKQINNSPVPADAHEPPKTIKELQLKYKEYVDYDKFATKEPWFIPGSLEDIKRRNPEILSPTELRTQLVRADIPVHITMVDSDGTKKIAVLKAVKVELPKKLRDRLKQISKMRGGEGGAGGGAAGGGGGGPRMGSGRSGGGGIMNSAAAEAARNQTITQLKYEDLDKLDKVTDAIPAEDILPVHMVVVSGCFPYAEQLENFRRALHKATAKDVLSMVSRQEAYWEFAKVDVERQVLRNGTIVTPWEPYNDQLVDALKRILYRASEWEDEDPELAKFTIINPGLIMARPKLARNKAYPPEDLAGIKESLELLTKSKTEPVKPELSPLAKRSQGPEGIDPFNPFNPAGSDDSPKQPGPGALMGGGAPPPPPATSDGPAPPAGPGGGLNRIHGAQPFDVINNAIENTPIPKMALLRIIDATVEPGFTYQYRLRVRMLNPNYGKKNVASRGMARTKELVAKDWTTVDPIEVPPDAYWYISEDRRDPEKATVQIQRWLDYVFPDPKNERFRASVAEWTILEKTPVYRGEYIGGRHRVKVPMWKIEQSKYELARPPRSSQAMVPVDLSVRGSRAQDPALLIDIDVGKVTKTRSGPRATTSADEAPLQLLVLTPDGRLIVRSAEEDAGDQEWQKRYHEWKQWVTELEIGKLQKQDSVFDRRGN